MKDAVIVGAGIVGTTIALALKSQGRDVTVLDRGEELAGTRPSGGHLKPGWFAGMRKQDYEPAMELLDNTWGLITEEFVVKPTNYKTTVYRVDTDKVLRFPSTKESVTDLTYSYGEYPVVTTENGQIECKLLIVAAGVWTEELFSRIVVKRKQGISFRFQGKLRQPFINTWAPYKQIVAHQQTSKEIWIGDGTAILQKNWTLGRQQQSLSRCRKSLPEAKRLLKIHRGLRPYIKTGKEPCLVEQVSKRVWVVTGAGKLGTIAAGWAAGRILNATS